MRAFNGFFQKVEFVVFLCCRYYLFKLDLSRFPVVLPTMNSFLQFSLFSTFDCDVISANLYSMTIGNLMSALIPSPTSLSPLSFSSDVLRKKILTFTGKFFSRYLSQKFT